MRLPPPPSSQLFTFLTECGMILTRILRPLATSGHVLLSQEAIHGERRSASFATHLTSCRMLSIGLQCSQWCKHSKILGEGGGHVRTV